MKKPIAECGLRINRIDGLEGALVASRCPSIRNPQSAI